MIPRPTLVALTLALTGCLAPTPQGPRLAEPAHPPREAPSHAPGGGPAPAGDPPASFERPDADEGETEPRG